MVVTAASNYCRLHKLKNLPKAVEYMFLLVELLANLSLYQRNYGQFWRTEESSWRVSA